MVKITELFIHEIAAGNLDTKFGRFRIHYFSDGREDAVALVKGEIKGERDVLCRIHSQCLFSEAFYSTECDCSEQIELALKNIQTQGGIFIYLFQNGRGYGLAPLILTQDLKEKGMNQQKAFEYKGFFDIERSFDIAAKILSHFKIGSIRLFTKNKAKIECMRKYGITVNDSGLNSSVVIYNKKTENQLYYKQLETMPITERTVIIISDLNVDEILCITDDNGVFIGFNQGVVETTGGCAFNSARIFKGENLDPVILGSVGNDTEGNHILNDLEKNQIKAFIYKSNKPTGKSEMLYENDGRRICSQPENANEYNSKIADIVNAMTLNANNLIYVTSHLLIRGTKENVLAIRDAIYHSKAKILIDIVPHNLYKTTTWDFFCEVFNKPVFMVICELKTILSFHPQLKPVVGNEDEVDDSIFENILEKIESSDLKTEYLVLRYGFQNIGKQRVYKKKNGRFNLCLDEETGFIQVKPEERRGYGEILTARLIKKYHDGYEQ